MKPVYSQAPIRSLETLSRVLTTPLPRLLRVAHRADELYRPVSVKKKDGTPRQAWQAAPDLKRIQVLLKVRLLDRVRFPLYLHGGIHDPESPRDYARNAAMHVRQRLVINEDIKDFFPSITSLHVGRIWTGFFRFDDEVADVLTRLTTRCGSIPQGAHTSNHLANLVFFNVEATLVARLDAMGWRYSRLTDDITVSTSRVVTAACARRREIRLNLAV